MSLLIIQTQAPSHSLARDSYGVITTGAMLNQNVSVVYVSDGVKQLADPGLREQISTAIEFGVQALYVSAYDCEYHQIDLDGLPDQIQKFERKDLYKLIAANDKVLSF
jgi:sulfur relay (sulfurtransferase) DsrF/TusC family protein